VLFWHREVKHGDVGLVLDREFHRRSAVASLRHDMPAVDFGDHGAKPASHELMIVGDENRGLLHAATGDMSGTDATIEVPVESDSMVRLPPNWRRRSRIPARPTPVACALVGIADTVRPRPKSRTSTQTRSGSVFRRTRA